VGLRQVHEVASRLALHVGGVNDRQSSGGQPFAGDVAQHVERVFRCALVVLVVGDQAPAEVAGDDFVPAEVLTCEGGLARARGTHERDQRELRDDQRTGFWDSVAARIVGAVRVRIGHAAAFA